MNFGSVTSSSAFQSAEYPSSDSSDKQDVVIPDRVLIRDRFSDEWVFSTSVYYVFEGEDIPTSIPKDSSILAEIDSQTQEVKSLSSFSPHFLAYDATFISPSSVDKEVLVPEVAFSKTFSTLVIDGAYSNSLSNKQQKNQLLLDIQEGKVTLTEAIESLNSSFSLRNQTLQSILDLEASDYQKISPSISE